MPPVAKNELRPKTASKSKAKAKAGKPATKTAAKSSAKPAVSRKPQALELREKALQKMSAKARAVYVKDFEPLLKQTSADDILNRWRLGGVVCLVLDRQVYGEKAIDDFAEASGQYSAGYLREMARVARTWPLEKDVQRILGHAARCKFPINFTHLQTLARLVDPGVREKFTTTCIEEGWAATNLLMEVKRYLCQLARRIDRAKGEAGPAPPPGVAGPSEPEGPRRDRRAPLNPRHGVERFIADLDAVLKFAPILEQHVFEPIKRDIESKGALDADLHDSLESTRSRVEKTISELRVLLGEVNVLLGLDGDDDEEEEKSIPAARTKSKTKDKPRGARAASVDHLPEANGKAFEEDDDEEEEDGDEAVRLARRDAASALDDESEPEEEEDFDAEDFEDEDLGDEADDDEEEVFEE